MKRFTVILAAALALAACAKQESVRPVQQGEVRFTTNIQTYTVKATDTAFENNDEIGIFAGAPISKNNVKAVVTGTSLIPVTPIKWVEDNNSVVDFVAYYPYAEAATLTDYVFEVQTNQSSAANYTKSDLMLAKKSSAPTENAVELAFSHALSKVVISLTNSVPETTVSRVEFEGVKMSAKVNLSTGAVSELGAEGTITANANGTAYQLILLPQSASPKVNVYLSNGNKYTYELASAFTFKAGKKASAALVVNPQQEAGVVEFSFTVSDWEVDADALEFGDPSVEAGTPEHTWSVIGSMNGDEWKTDIPMVLTDGKWTATITYAAGDEFKLRADGAWDLSAGIKSSWENQVFIAGENPDPYLEENSPRNIKLEAAGEYKLEFEYPDYKFVVTKLSGEDPQPVETATLTLNVLNTVGWETMNVYCWTDTDPWPRYTAEWPGDAAAATDVAVGEKTFKSFTIAGIPQNATDVKYILNNGNGGEGNQTANLDLPALTSAEVTLYIELKTDLTVAEVE
ncbi:MAG: fimbrillin family protein [Bacteroidales bacterium]|nr:fimbrillin family protein [Bacteroidales bacterium]